jgi:hypothetical protein
MTTTPSSPMTLRPYQAEAVQAVYQHLRTRDDNPCVVIPTAGGKTPVMSTICRDAVQQWDGRVLILAHVKELLEQAVDKLHATAPDLWHRIGVYSASLKSRDTDHPIIVAGIQSVYRRAAELDRFDLILIDEAHMIPPSGDGMCPRRARAVVLHVQADPRRHQAQQDRQPQGLPPGLGGEHEQHVQPEEEREQDDRFGVQLRAVALGPTGLPEVVGDPPAQLDLEAVVADELGAGPGLGRRG